MRPVPLFRDPELVTVLEPSPLDNLETTHRDYLSAQLSGNVLLVAADEQTLDELAAFARALATVEQVTTHHNPASRRSDVDKRALAAAVEDAAPFDTIVYRKDRAAWLARSPDFHALTPLLATGGRLLSKAKWVPDSKRVALEEIAVVDPFGFEPPQVYLAYGSGREQRTFADAAWATDDQPDSAGAPTADGGAARGPSVGCHGDSTLELAHQTRAFETQFSHENDATEYTPGWSWHSELTDHVAERLAAVDGPVVNLCCGTSDLGDIRVDLLTAFADGDERCETAATVQADARAVPLASNSVAAVVTDPPWKVSVEQRVRLFSEAQRIVAPGGTIIDTTARKPTPSGVGGSAFA